MDRKAYSTDLTDAQWGLLEPLLPPESSRGHPRTVNLREVVNGILYMLRGGIPWRLMPHDLPPWGTGLVVLSKMAERWHLGAC